MARIFPMPLELAEVLDAAGKDRVTQLIHEMPVVWISERRQARFQQQAHREKILEIADQMDGLVLEYHYGWRDHNDKFLFAVKSIEDFEAMVAVFEIMVH